MSKHTRGPWTIEIVRTVCGVCMRVGPFPWKRGKINHACIYADYPGNGPEYQELVANARLIAASPDLLDALTGIAKELGFDWLRPEFDKARDAITKATGDRP